MVCITRDGLIAIDLRIENNRRIKHNDNQIQ